MLLMPPEASLQITPCTVALTYPPRFAEMQLASAARVHPPTAQGMYVHICRLQLYGYKHFGINPTCRRLRRTDQLESIHISNMIFEKRHVQHSPKLMKGWRSEPAPPTSQQRQTIVLHN